MYDEHEKISLRLFWGRRRAHKKPLSTVCVSLVFEERQLGKGQSSSLAVHQPVIALITTVAGSILEYD